MTIYDLTLRVNFRTNIVSHHHHYLFPLMCLPLGVYLEVHEGKTPDQVIREVSVQFSRSVMSNSLPPHESQHARPPCPSPTPRAYSNSCPSSR